MSVKLFSFTDARGQGIGLELDGRAHRLWDAEDLRGALLAMATGAFRPSPAGLQPLEPGWRPRPPIASPQKILGVGQNYVAHAAEMGAASDAAARTEPTFFAKLPSSLAASGDPIVIPPHLAGTRVDHEGELAIILGRPARNVDVSSARAMVAGFTIANDVTARSLQAEAKEKGRPWTWAKGQDTFCPIGPYVVPAGGVDPDNLEIVCRVNGEERQRARTNTMRWNVAELIAHASRHVSLQPGDILLTGTPAGVGPLEPGDTVEVEIQGIGVLSNPVIAG